MLFKWSHTTLECKLITPDQIWLLKTMLHTEILLKPSQRGSHNQRQVWRKHPWLLGGSRPSTSNNLVLRIVIPHALQQQVLNNLHNIHCLSRLSMSACANQSVYWPGMNASIQNHRSTCQSCNQIAPSEPSEPLIKSPSPEWLFQQICADYFETEEQS